MNNILIGQRISKALSAAGVMQKQLAAELGVTNNTISYWCSGSRTPNTKQVIQIAKYLGVSADYLLGLSPVQTTDATTQAVCVATGLSEKAVNRLVSLFNVNKSNPAKELKSLSCFLESNRIYDFMTWLKICVNPEEDIMYWAQLEVSRQYHYDMDDPETIERAKEVSSRDALFMAQETCRKIIEDMKKE